MAPSIKLTYFPIPGRGETSRILLTYAGIPFENAVIEFSSWPAIKPTTPYGQVPLLEVDGKILAQSSAIEHYLATLAGLTPSDPWQAAKVDEVYAFVAEINETFGPTGAIKDEAERIKARLNLLAGPVKLKLEKLASILEAAGGEYLVGGKLSLADLAAYSFFSGLLVSGFLDGIPKDLLDQYPTLKAHHNRIAALPAIAAKYENAEGLRTTFKPLP